jgi:hypothetical protein
MNLITLSLLLSTALVAPEASAFEFNLPQNPFSEIGNSIEKFFDNLNPHH